LLEELFSCILKEEDVTIVEWVTNLEGIDCISILGLNLFLDLLGGVSIAVEPVVELNFRNKSHVLS